MHGNLINVLANIDKIQSIHPLLPWQVSIQIYKLYKMHGNIINISANIDKTQYVLPCLYENGGTTWVLIKCCLVYQSPYMSRNVCLHVIMLALKDLLDTPLKCIEN